MTISARHRRQYLGEETHLSMQSKVEGHPYEQVRHHKRSTPADFFAVTTHVTLPPHLPTCLPSFLPPRLPLEASSRRKMVLHLLFHARAPSPPPQIRGQLLRCDRHIVPG